MRALLPSACRHHRAFTLIELLVVIVILGILMAVAVPTFLRQQSKAQDSRTQQYLTTAFKAIRAGLPDTNQLYPQSTSMVSWITQSEPELGAQSGSCTTGVQTAPVDRILVDPSSTPTGLTLCARSQSGNVWKLSASNTGVQQLLDGTLVPLTMSGNEITDTVRSTSGDGLSSDSSTGIWESTTNLDPNGGFESGVGTTSGTGGSITRSWSTDSKFGSYALQAVSNDAAGDSFEQPNIAVSPSTTYTLTAWVKMKTGESDPISIQMNGHSNTAGYYFGPVVALTSSWQRVSDTFTTSASENGVRPMFAVKLPPYGPNINVGDGFVVDGIQLEQKGYATPYVETNGATAVRNAGRVQAPSSLLNATQGWVAFRTRVDWANTTPPASPNGRLAFFQWDTGPGSNLIDVTYNDPAASAYQNTWTLERASPGYDDGTHLANTFSAGAVRTIVAAWTATTLKISVNGSPFTTAATSSAPAGLPSTFEIGDNAQDTSFFGISDADFFWFATGTGTLTDADAATINGFGNTDPKLAAFPASAQTTMVWNGASSSGSLK